MKFSVRDFLIAMAAFFFVAAFLTRTLGINEFAQSWPSRDKSTTSIAADARATSMGTAIVQKQTTLVRTEDVKVQNRGSGAEGVDIYGVTVRVNAPNDVAVSREQRIVSQFRSSGSAASSGININITGELNSSGDELQHDVPFAGMAGQVLRFPKKTHRETYQLWNSDTDRSWPAEFVRTENVDGKPTFVFRQRVPRTLVGAVGSKSTTSSPISVAVDRTMWVRPEIGAIVRNQLHSTKWIGEGSTQIVTLDATFVDKSADVRRESAAVDRAVTRTNWLVAWAPLMLAVIGVFALFAIVLVGSGKRILMRQKNRSPRTKH